VTAPLLQMDDLWELAIPARKTNNQASFGGSILKNNMEAEAAMELLRHLDETGLHIVYTIYQSSNICLLIGFCVVE
jgi:hypothetical protein